eukprot:TRINITY_DN4693_c0_g1_i1.p1 TRINITY_DN4693_c0_g1~~TRINITY_DN4693_c0_g1_i1.p1  ORF type:complete len:277 (-),score=35.17 TRINITY_DN4693_c0_g1_i1:1011-1841(-)
MGQEDLSADEYQVACTLFEESAQNGTLTLWGLHDVLLRIGNFLPIEDLEQRFSVVDVLQVGCITLVQYLDFLKQLKVESQFTEGKSPQLILVKPHVMHVTRKHQKVQKEEPLIAHENLGKNQVMLASGTTKIAFRSDEYHQKLLQAQEGNNQRRAKDRSLALLERYKHKHQGDKSADVQTFASQKLQQVKSRYMGELLRARLEPNDCRQMPLLTTSESPDVKIDDEHSTIMITNIGRRKGGQNKAHARLSTNAYCPSLRTVVSAQSFVGHDHSCYA